MQSTERHAAFVSSINATVYLEETAPKKNNGAFSSVFSVTVLLLERIGYGNCGNTIGCAYYT